MTTIANQASADGGGVRRGTNARRAGLARRALFLCAAAAATATGCASAQAKAPVPALNVPPPPPHLVELPAEPVEPVGDVPNPGATPPAGSSGASRTSRPSTPRPQAGDSRPDAKPADAKPGESKPEAVPETGAPAPVPPPPNPQLRTPQTADTGTAAKTVRTTIDRARSALATVNFGPLSNERKKAYNDAKLLIQQAEDALKEGNLVFAQGVAQKAETLARELAGR